MKLERLICCRDNLLLCELGVLLHDLGKFSIEFNKSFSRQSQGFTFKHEWILGRRGTGELPGSKNDRNAASIIQALQCNLGHLSEANEFEGTNKQRRELERAIIAETAHEVLGADYTVSNALRDICKEGFISKDFVPDDFKELFNSKCISIPGLTTVPVLLGDFIDIEYLDKSNKLFSTLFHECDHHDSGIDKAYTSEESMQDGPIFCSSTSFGIEHPLDGDSIQNGRVKFCNIIADFISDIFGESKCLQQDALSMADWERKRRGILTDAEKLLGLTVAETRRSANDVSLWHHSYAVASLFKSSMAAQLLDGSIDDKWSILAVNFNMMGLIEKSHKIGDILGYVEFVREKLCRTIKRVVEVVCPLGNEIYRDESGIYFTFPGLGKELRNSVAEELKQLLFDEEPIRDFDLPLSLSVSKPSAYIVEIGSKINEGYQKADFSTDDNIPDWVEHWKLCDEARDAGNAILIRSFIYYDYECRDCERSDCLFRDGAQIPRGDRIPRIDRCPVCQTRPKCTQQKICNSCYTRRVGRLGNWLNGKKHEPTIWLSEVADRNRRIALITGQFGLWEWFRGTYVDSFFSQSLHKQRSALQKFLESHGKYSELMQEISDYVPGDNFANSSSMLSRMLRKNRYILGEEQGSFKTKDFIDQRNYRLDLKNSNEEYAHFLVCKPPSPSRLRRIWETTQQFWDETVSKQILHEHFYGDGGPRNDRYVKRLLLIPKHIKPSNLVNRRLYEVKICGFVLSAIWLNDVSDDGGFLVVDNLSRIRELYEPVEFFSNKRLEYTDNSENTFCICVDAKWVGEGYSEYLPAITLHTSPLSFMAVVPAEDALEIIKRIRNEYERQFGKVANRLPLDIGAIFFADKFPLYVAVDAARRMMDSFRAKQQKAKVGDSDSRWEVVCVKIPCSGKYVELTLAKVGDAGKHHHLVREISVELGDENKTDVFYPYFVMIIPDEGQLKRDGRDYFLWPDEEGNWRPLVHVCHLKKGDIVSHLESHFDFEYLSSISAINNLNFDSAGNRIAKTLFRSKRNWGLHQVEEIEKVFDILKDNLTTTQIHQLREILVAAINQWQLSPDSSAEQIEVYRQFAKATLARLGDGELWRNVDDDKRSWLVECCVSGFIFDVLELYLDTLKQGVE